MSTLEIVLLALWPTVVVVGIGIAVWQARQETRDGEDGGDAADAPDSPSDVDAR